MEKQSKIYIAGNTGMVGSAICRNLKQKGFTNLIYTPYPEYDLTNQKQVQDFFRNQRPQYVIDAAAKVGGIVANDTYRGQFLYENMMIQNNLIHFSKEYGVKKFLFLGSSCIYPRDCPQPIKEEYLLSGPLEESNEPYAIAKISGIKMCENYFRQYESNFISIMPTNLYGPGDNFNLANSHVIPALIRKFHEARINNLPNVEVWGTGRPLREFLYVDDMADACTHVLETVNAAELYDQDITHINIGTGLDHSIAELAKIIKDVVGYRGDVLYDRTKPDGTRQKLLDVTRIKDLGWRSKVTLKVGLDLTYRWYLETKGEHRK